MLVEKNVRFTLMRYGKSEPVNFLLYEGVETIVTLGIILIVQYVHTILVQF